MGARFIGNVVVEQDGKWWVLRESIRYEDDYVQVVVPAGFVTDFASVPRAFWSLFPPVSPRYAAAALVHDRLYETQELPRPAADAAFRRAMAVLGTPLWERWVLWAAVRGGGRHAFATARERHRVRMHVWTAYQWRHRTRSSD